MRIAVVTRSRKERGMLMRMPTTTKATMRLCHRRPPRRRVRNGQGSRACPCCQWPRSPKGRVLKRWGLPRERGGGGKERGGMTVDRTGWGKGAEEARKSKSY